jgi:hypothetical protein
VRDPPPPPGLRDRHPRAAHKNKAHLFMPGIKHRKHDRHRPLALSTLMTGIALGLPSLAATPAASPVSMEASPTQLPVVHVKARRNPYKADAVQSPRFTQSLLDTPQTINVIGKEIIQQQGATTLTEALRNSPGVGTFYVGENGSTSTGDAIYMRGFDTSGSIFVDGARDLGSISRRVQCRTGRGHQRAGRYRIRPHRADRCSQHGQQAAATEASNVGVAGLRQRR